MPGFYTGAYVVDCSTINGCIGADLFNFGQLYFTDYLKSLAYMVYDKAIDITVLNGVVILIALFLFLGFVVGLIFMRRR